MTTIALKISQGKQTHTLSDLPLESTVSDLKAQIFSLTEIPPSLQKLIFKGKSLQDSDTLAQANLVNGAKVFLMASQSTDIAKVAAGAIVTSLLPPVETLIQQRESLSDQTVHLEYY